MSCGDATHSTAGSITPFSFKSRSTTPWTRTEESREGRRGKAAPMTRTKSGGPLLVATLAPQYCGPEKTPSTLPVIVVEAKGSLTAFAKLGVALSSDGKGWKESRLALDTR